MNPGSPYQAKFSMAYCVAAALLEGRVALEQFAADRFGPDGVREPALAALLRRARVRVADDLTARYPAAWPARVTVTLVDGSRVTEASDYPRGNPENPVDSRELRDKFVALVEPRLGRAAAQAALDAVDALPGMLERGQAPRRYERHQPARRAVPGIPCEPFASSVPGSGATTGRGWRRGPNTRRRSSAR